jgi:hypothetical protein
MSQPNPIESSIRPSRALPQVRLLDQAQDQTVRVLSLREGDLAFEPFPLPPVPRSVLDWLIVCGERFWRQHRRCIAVLLLDTKTRQWALAIPAQRCGREAACWSTARGDFPSFPDSTVLCGSFQSRRLSGGDEPIDAVPPSDGVHFVHVIGHPSDPCKAHCFLRCESGTRAVAPPEVLIDDWLLMIEQAMPRLTLS